MAYSTWEEVRRIAGILPQAEVNIPLRGIVDGSNKTFYLVQRYIVDSDGDQEVSETGSTYKDDITVYDDGAAVTVSSVNIDTGAIVLDAAPLANSVMTCSFNWSPVKDSTIASVIANVDDQIERLTNTKGVSTSKTEYFDGDGETKKFFFRNRPVTAITSLTVDGSSSLVANTDYFLKPERTRALYIEFADAPTEDNQNIEITYNYGESNANITQLSQYWAAHDILIGELGKMSFQRNSYTAEALEPLFITEQQKLALLRRIIEKIHELQAQLGGQFQIGVG